MVVLLMIHIGLVEGKMHTSMRDKLTEPSQSPPIPPDAHARECRAPHEMYDHVDSCFNRKSQISAFSICRFSSQGFPAILLSMNRSFESRKLHSQLPIFVSPWVRPLCCVARVSVRNWFLSRSRNRNRISPATGDRNIKVAS